jgi:hypothetical protein
MMKMLAAASEHFGTVVKSESVRPENIDLIRGVDAIVTRSRLKGQHLREGQVIIDTSFRWDFLAGVGDDLIEIVPLIKAFAGGRAISTLVPRVRFLNLIHGIIHGQRVIDSRKAFGIFELLTRKK